MLALHGYASLWYLWKPASVTCATLSGVQFDFASHPEPGAFPVTVYLCHVHRLEYKFQQIRPKLLQLWLWCKVYN
jgi:hypothetical protein